MTSQGDAKGSEVSVIVPVHNGGDDLRRCLAGIRQSQWPLRECIVVDDASTDNVAGQLAERFGARLLRRERQQGPAAARNAGAAAAAGDILFFTDADVVLHGDTIGQAVAVLDREAGVAAVFGSYDEQPGDPSLLSRYRNLYHHWNHQQGNAEASTFWSGCGAVRRGVFLALGGFSEAYPRPSIEDIELGYRLRAAGHRIRLLKTMQCTHLKRWTLGNMLHTDLFLRGVPWVALLQRQGGAPPDLNLGIAARLATVCTGVLVLSVPVLLALRPTALLPFAGLLGVCLAAAVLARGETAGPGSWRSLLAGALAVALPGAAWAVAPDPWGLLPLALTAAVAAVQLGFYRLLARLHGLALALAAVPLQLLFFLSCGIAVPLGLARHRSDRRARAE